MVSIQLGGRPLADFNEPLRMLEDCHRRIEHFLDVLRKVADKFGEEELTDEGRRALDSSLTYFAEAAPRHTADEEESLFPRMRQSTDPAVHAALAELERLEADHRRAEVMHKRVDQLGRRWLAAGQLSIAEREEFRELVDGLTAIYAVHIPQEEQRVFTLAARALTASELQQLGDEMRVRRRLPR